MIDAGDTVSRAERRVVGQAVDRTCPMCLGTRMRVHFVYDRQPPLEFKFSAIAGMEYRRELHRCIQCGHLLEWIDADLSSLYAGDYVNKVWGDRATILATYNRINALDPVKSDNVGRVAYVCSSVAKLRSVGDVVSLRLLDVGTGLGVFPYRMKAVGWTCVGIDLDETLMAHVREVVGIDARVADLKNLHGFEPFDLVTFNKVLEHVEDPVSLLAASVRQLTEDGLIYVELPDGEGAEVDGPDREEFLLGHMHVFSAASYALLIARAGLDLLTFDRIREPSTKFTLRGLARPRKRAALGV